MKTNLLILFTILFTTCAFAVSPVPDGGYPGGNTAEGDNSLLNLTTGTNNTAVGNSALGSVQGGISNTAIGAGALSTNNGSSNTAGGVQALNNSTTGGFNTAFGYGAQLDNTTGSENTSVGQASLISNTTGNFNTAIGNNAGVNLTIGNNNIDIGAEQRGVAGESNTIRIGVEGTQTSTFIAGVNGVNENSGNPVFIDPITGQLGTGTIAQGIPSKAFLAFPTGTAAPAGFTKIGTSVLAYRDLSGHNQIVPVDLYQKN